MPNLLAPNFDQQFFDENGDPLSGGKIYTYVAGTSTPAATYTDYSGATPNANPVVCDSGGRAAIWLGAGSYKIVIKDADDVTIKTIDQISWDELEEQDSLWTEHAILDGAAAADLSGETVNLSSYSSAVYEVEIIRGSATFASGQLAIQNVNGTGRVKVSSFMGDNPQVTFSVSQAGMVAQLRVAVTAGLGAGTIKLRRYLVPA